MKNVQELLMLHSKLSHDIYDAIVNSNVELKIGTGIHSMKLADSLAVQVIEASEILDPFFHAEPIVGWPVEGDIIALRRESEKTIVTLDWNGGWSLLDMNNLTNVSVHEYKTGRGYVIFGHIPPGGEND